MRYRRWWQKPQLITETEGTERRVSWLELFYDLVFVVVIAELAHYLAAHPNINGVIGYILMFLPVWWIWIGGTFYNTRFETHDVSYRLMTLAQMLPVAALALFIHDGLAESSIPFALTYAVARTLIIFLWLRGGWHEPRLRSVTNRYITGFSLSVVLFIVSIFVPTPWRFVLWGIGLFIDLITPLFTLRQQAALPRMSNEKLPERFGLFMIIVLGETIVGSIKGLAELQESGRFEITYLGLGIVLSFCLWWVYFDFIARRHPKRGVWWALSWAYGHLPLAMGIAAVGASVLNLVGHAEQQLAAPLAWLASGAIALVFVALGLLEWTLHVDPDEPTNPRISIGMKFLTAILALGVGLLGPYVGSSGMLVLLICLVLIHIAYGAYVWFTQPLEAEPEAEPELVLE